MLSILFLLIPCSVCEHTESILAVENAEKYAADQQFLHLMPKIELHAHLHGSIRQSTLLEFARLEPGSGETMLFFMKRVIH